MTALILFTIVPAMMAFAAASDVLTMTISNRLCLALAGLFVPAALFAGMPWADIGLHLAAGFLMLATCFALFAFGKLGGGDAKFAAAAAIWLGFDLLLPFLVLTAVIGGLLAIAMMWVKHHPIPALALRMSWYARLQDHRTGIPYGVPLAGAALLALPQAAIWRLAMGV